MRASDRVLIARAQVVIVARRLCAGLASQADLQRALDELNTADRERSLKPALRVVPTGSDAA
jgi:hypothetical protein